MLHTLKQKFNPLVN